MAYLTKSRFKLGLSCVTKLYYDSHRDIYPNADQSDPFLLALAEGGFQVGELAKFDYPGGVEIDTLDTEEAIRLTEAALEQDTVTIYEAAIRVDHCFIRVDILQKTPEYIRLIEVKSKSCEGDDESQFMNADGVTPSSKWRPYLEDVVFQQLVMERYLIQRQWTQPVIPYLMCVDKQKRATVDGLHTRFRIRTHENGRKYCEAQEGLRAEQLGESILTAIRLKDAKDAILRYPYKDEHPAWQEGHFEEIIYWFEDLLKEYEQGQAAVREPMSMECKSCPYRTESGLDEDGMKSGYRECGRVLNGWHDEQVWAPKVYEVWNYRGARERIAENRWFMRDLQPEELETSSTHWEAPTPGEGLSTVQRQWIQVSQSSGVHHHPYVDVEGLRAAMEEVTYPLHFIDFETSAPAIPFYAGYRPYQGLCFQFSHHIMEQDGSVRHATEYLGLGQGEDPSWGFIEALHEALRHDEGTIFRYHNHENTYLGYVRKALKERSPFDPAKTQELIQFIESITRPTGSVPVEESWEPGPRNMVDLCQMVKDYYWHPEMAGSNSIKAVLPAILEHSAQLQEKYGRPVYGSTEMPSKNFPAKVWLERNERDEIIDPYSLLPLLDEHLPSAEELDRLYSNEKLGNGGAAMTAWAYMQLAEMSVEERDALAAALKCYCELDTLAMVMIWEGWEDLAKEL